MTSQRPMTIQHTNGLSGYISNWRLTLYQLYQKLKVQPPGDMPQELVSLVDNIDDLSLMLSYLDAKLTILEETTSIAGQQIDYEAYSEARSFLKVSYLLVRKLFDDVSGVIRYFYDKNEPNSGVTKSFNSLLNKAKNGNLPEALSTVLRQTIVQFPKMKDRRDGLLHDYESLLISFKKDKDGETVLGHFSTKGRTSKQYEDIRQYFGIILCEYQTLIDDLLDHFDTKFMDWYRFKPQRIMTIYGGHAGIMLWWAYKYGNYRHKYLQVVENNEGEVVNEKQ